MYLNCAVRPDATEAVSVSHSKTYTAVPSPRPESVIDTTSAVIGVGSLETLSVTSPPSLQPKSCDESITAATRQR